jgi:hypothetical protein
MVSQRQCSTLRKMTRYPILFGYSDLVLGSGFVATVSLNGRALLEEDGGDFWMFGVNPGGLAAGGADRGAALSAFRSAYRSVLHDLASEAVDFDRFRNDVESFFRETNTPTLQEWEEAVAAVRSGTVTADWLAKRSAETPCRIEVVRVGAEGFKPEQNRLDDGEALAAAHPAAA